MKDTLSLHDALPISIGNTYRKKGVGVIFINSNDPGVRKIDSFEGMQEQIGRAHV